MRSRVTLAGLLAIMLSAGLALAAETWTTYRYPDRAFAVSFPAAPSITRSTPHGANPVVEYLYQLAGANFAHEVSVVEYQPGRGVRGDGTAFLNSLVDRYAKGSGAAVQSRGPVTLAGHPGVEAVLEDKTHGTDHLIDLVLGKDRVYLLASVGPAGNSASPEAKRFRDSFQMLEK